MRKSISILAIVAALFMVCSCQKESTTVLRATINQYNGNNGKAYLAADDYVNWHEGDKLLVNGHEATITGTASPFTVEVQNLEENTETFFAVFPMANSTMSGNSARVTIPAVQTYEADAAGNQILNAPMAAKQVRNASGVTTLMFYNLASLFEISLPDNVAGATIKSIDVYNVANSFGGAAINGTADVSFGDNNVTMGTVDGTHVTKLEVNATHVANRKYYVVVAPVNGAQFQVVVNYETTSHNLGVAQVKQNRTNNILPANMIAPITLTNDNSYDPYLAGYYVSPGNVQCYVDNPNVTWPGDDATDAEKAQYYADRYQYRFAAHQWEMAGENNLIGQQLKWDPYVDLFPYGTTNNPEARNWGTFLNTTNHEMKEFSESGIGIDFSDDWTIPHTHQTMVVLSKHDGSMGNDNNGQITLGRDATIATIHVTDDPHGHETHVGLVVLPDLYPGTRFAVGDGNPDIVINAEEWMLMESLGAVFLPVAGQISGSNGNDFSYSGNHSTGMGFYTLKEPIHGQNCEYLIINDGTSDRCEIKGRNGGYHARAFRLIRPAPGVTAGYHGPTSSK